jgi:hypothetical protein
MAYLDYYIKTDGFVQVCAIQLRSSWQDFYGDIDGMLSSWRFGTRDINSRAIYLDRSKGTALNTKSTFTQTSNELKLTINYQNWPDMPVMEYNDEITPTTTLPDLLNARITDSTAQLLAEPSTCTRLQNKSDKTLEFTWALLPDATLPATIDAALFTEDYTYLPYEIIIKADVVMVPTEPAEAPADSGASAANTPSGTFETNELPSWDHSQSYSVTGRLEQVLFGWVMPNRCNPDEVIASVLPLNPCCEVAFIGRAFETRNGSITMLAEVITDWSPNNCVIMRRPLAGLRVGPKVRITYSALLRTLGSLEPITEFILDGAKIIPSSLPMMK